MAVPPTRLLADAKYGIMAELKVYLDQSGGLEPPGGVAGWVEAHTGLVKGPDVLDVHEALQKARELVEFTETKHIIGIRLNWDWVYLESKGQEDLDNREEAFSAALNSQKEPGKVGEVGVWSHGFTDEFELQQDAVLKLKESAASPAMAATLWGVPIEWTERPDEDAFDRSERVNAILDDRDSVRAMERQSRIKMEEFLRRYQELVRGLFLVKEIKQELKVDLTGVAV